VLGYPSDTTAQSTANSALPYVVITLVVAVLLLAMVFASNSTISGSIAHALFGSYFAAVIIAAVIFGASWVWLTQLFINSQTTWLSYNSEQTGHGAAIGLSVFALLLLTWRCAVMRRKESRRQINT
jgi:hypothetical protein